MRQNYYYIERRRPDAETRPARPKDAGTEAHRHAQSTPRYDYRSPLPGKSFLRPQRSSPSPLRDATSSYCREHVDSRCGSSLRGLAAEFYLAQAAFERSGLAGLLPSARGPKGGHKVTAEVLDYVANLRAANPSLTTVQCVHAVQQRFGITIHRRSLERAQAKKKRLRRT